MFKDRVDAGNQLLDLASQYDHEIDLILAIPRGGVDVADSIARSLNKPLKLISAKRLGAPHDPEIAIGAVAPDGSTWINDELVERYNLNSQQIQEISDLAHQHQKQRSNDNEVDLNGVEGKGILIVDDGAATGAAILASIEALRRAGAHPVGVAVPVAPIDVVSVMEDRADYFLALETPSDFIAVSQYYQNF